LTKAQKGVKTAARDFQAPPKPNHNHWSTL